MSFTKVYLDTSRQEQVQSRLNDDGTTEQQVIQTWIAVSDSIATSPVAALTASVGGNTIPVVATSYTIGGVSGFVCDQTLPKRSTESPYVFEVQAQYTRKRNPAPSGSGTAFNIDISVDGEKLQQDAFYDRNLDPIVNSAKQSFSPTLKRTYYDRKIEISYQTTSDSFGFETLRGKVNNDSIDITILGVPIDVGVRQLLLENVGISLSAPLEGTGAVVYNVRFTLLQREDTFKDKVIDQGYYQLVAGELSEIVDKNSIAVSQPAHLHSDGTALDPTDPAEFLTFEIEPESALAGLFTAIQDA